MKKLIANLDIINEFKNTMLKRIEEEANVSIAKVKTRYKALYDAIENDLKNVDRMHEDIETYLSKLRNDSFIDDTDHFVTLKLADRDTTTGNEFVSEILWKPLERNTFECNNSFETMLKEDSLGHLKGQL